MYKSNSLEVECSSFFHSLIMLRFFKCFKQHTLPLSFFFFFFFLLAHGNALNMHCSIMAFQSLICSSLTTSLHANRTNSKDQFKPLMCKPSNSFLLTVCRMYTCILFPSKYFENEFCATFFIQPAAALAH